MTPMPGECTRLPGELWGVTAYFNPAGYENKLANLMAFCAGVRRQGLKLAVVELAFKDAPFVVDDGLADMIVRRRSDAVLWQKERLLNVGLASLPVTCDKVAWLDGDILFENDNWVQETAELLDSFVVVQPYEATCWLPQGVDWAPRSDFGPGEGEGRIMPGMGCAMAKAASRHETPGTYFEQGHCGFAWAARRFLLTRHGFYDRQILGNGDFVMAHAMYGNEDLWNGHHWQCQWLSGKQLDHAAAWSRGFHEDVQGSVSHARGRILHLWHGRYEDREYGDRLGILKEAGFDPEADITVDSGGCWQWSTSKPELHRRVLDYFLRRKEDGPGRAGDDVRQASRALRAAGAGPGRT